MKEQLILAYDILCKAVLGQEDDLDDTTINKFLRNLKNYYVVESLDSWFISNYLLYQFSYWSDKQTRRRDLPKSWIFGPKAIERWIILMKTGDQSWQYHLANFQSKYRIIFPVRYAYVDMKKKIAMVRESCNGTLEGLLNCLELGYYSEESIACQNCQYSKICKEN